LGANLIGFQVLLSFVFIMWRYVDLLLRSAFYQQLYASIRRRIDAQRIGIQRLQRFCWNFSYWYWRQAGWN
jgi:hypothetical protein